MSHIPTVSALIGGERLLADDAYEVTDPTDGSTIALVQDASAAIASRAGDAAASAAPVWRNIHVDDRRRALALAADALQARRDDLVELAIADTGARRAVAADMQVDAAI